MSLASLSSSLRVKLHHDVYRDGEALFVGTFSSVYIPKEVYFFLYIIEGEEIARRSRRVYSSVFREILRCSMTSNSFGYLLYICVYLKELHRIYIENVIIYHWKLERKR